MPRPIFDQSKIAPDILERMIAEQSPIVNEVSNAVEKNKAVVVGMKGNPHCKRACAALQKADINYQYLEYGSYFAEWKKRLSLKIWLGWKTFPMVFVDGQFIGGANEVVAYLKRDAGKNLK